MHALLMGALATSSLKRGLRLAPTNAAPTVGASNQSVAFSAAVSITATAIDTDGTIASYLWTKISGTNSPTLSGSTTATLTFTAPGTTDTLVYRCTVTDNLGATGFCDVTITVAAGGAGTFTAKADPALFAADGNAGSSIVGYFVLFDTTSKAPFGGYAGSQYFAGGDPVAGLVVTGLSTSTTYYYVIAASTDGVTPGMPSNEASTTT